MKGILSTVDLDDGSLVAKSKASPGLIGRDLASEVMPQSATSWDLGLHAIYRVQPAPGALPAADASPDPGHPPGTARRPHVVALDFGMKWNILRHLVDLGFQVTVSPGSATAEAILDLRARRDLHLQRPRRSRGPHRSDRRPCGR